MAEEKTRKEILQKIIDFEVNFPNTVKSPSPAKYKSRHKSEPTNLPDIEIGKRVVIRIHKNNEIMKRNDEVDGYGLASIVDYDVEKSRWNLSTTMIVVIEKVSQEHLKDQIGRLYAVQYDQRNTWRFSKRSLISFNEHFIKWV